eukprot:9503287-Pyramimonas_sp.AAC.1
MIWGLRLWEVLKTHVDRKGRADVRREAVVQARVISKLPRSPKCHYVEGRNDAEPFAAGKNH